MKRLFVAAVSVAALFVAAPAVAAGVTIGGTIGAADPTFTHLANNSCTTSSGQTTHYDAIQFFTVGNAATTISVSVTPNGFTGAVFLYQGGFLPDAPIVNCYDTASSVVGTTSGGTLSFSTNFGALPASFTEEPWTLVVTTDSAASAGGSYSATISSSATGVALPSTTTITSVSPEPSSTGESADVQFTVTNQFGGTPAPSGTVSVTTDGPESCSASVATGHCTIVFTSSGSRQVTANYPGDSTYQSSQDFSTHTVNAGAVDTTPPVVTVPANVVAEATGPAGAVVTYPAATAVDAVDGPVTATCTPASGSTFPLGTTTVTCTATDTAGNTGSASFTVTVQDTTAPVVTAPANVVAEATGPSGAVVTYPAATAVDTVDGAVTATCTPASGSTFPIGTTSVTCAATDTAGNTGAASFTVTVQDTTAPVVTAPANVVAEATGPSGAVVTYPAATAVDAVEGAVAATCAPASGSTFPIGTTTVTCAAVDTSGNTAGATFTVTVEDTTAPVYAPASDVTVNATSPAGATVTYATPTATDAVGVVSNTCAPASGSTFPIGATTVTCTAADAAGNAATTTFTVTVVSAAGQIVSLEQQVQAISPAPKLGGSLSNKLSSVQASLDAGNVQDACDTLQGFIHEVEAQAGRKLTAADAAALVDAATQIRAVLGC